MNELLALKWDLAVGESRRSTLWKAVQMTWYELVEKLTQTKRTKETYVNYKALPKTEQDEIKDVGGFVGGVLKEGKRQKGQVISRQLLTLDADFAPIDLWDQIYLLYNFTCCLYSTHKHSSETPRYRVVIPLARPVTEEEYEAVARRVAGEIGIDYFDDTTYEATRLMYWPSTSCDGEFVGENQEGPLLDPDQVLASYENWKDWRQWPISSREGMKHQKVRMELGNPAEKPGLIGTFCTCYGIDEAIEHFLGDIYSPVEGLKGQRYTYKAGSTTGGAVVYDNQYLYSHHGTDPAGGRSLNAFDLVRIHRFGHLDREGQADVEISRLPSYQKMLEWVSQEKRVKQSLFLDMQKALVEQSENEGGDPQQATRVSQQSGQEKQPSEQVMQTKSKVEGAIEYLYIGAQGKTCVNTSLLAQYIRQNCDYQVVRKQGFDNEFLYWYENGYYKLISPNEFKGRIKHFIPREMRRPSQWEDTYRELLTDRTHLAFEDLDHEEHLINVKNGLYNLKTHQLEPHTPKLLMTIQLNCPYHQKAPKPKEWLAFIDTLTQGDQEVAAVLQEWFGLTISNIPGHITKKCLGLAGAVGNTGKTQYNNMLDHMIGRHHICATPLQDYEKSFGLGDVYGAKAILIDDQSASSIGDCSNFKKLTGGGLINCEIKGKQSFPYIFRGTITFGCNDLPYFKDDKGDHLFERFIIVPCDNVIPKHKRRGDILESFKQETDGIFLWALEGLERLVANNYQFTPSGKCDKAMMEYIGMNDSFYRFIREGYEVTGEDKDRVSKKELEQAYLRWTQEQDIEPIKRRNLVKRAAKHGIRVKKSGTNYYVGVRKK